jgi:hypothetical protein
LPLSSSLIARHHQGYGRVDLLLRPLLGGVEIDSVIFRADQVASSVSA